MNTALFDDPEVVTRRHHAALQDSIDLARRCCAAAVVASNSAPDAWRHAVLEQSHEQLLSILARLRQLAS